MKQAEISRNHGVGLVLDRCRLPAMIRPLFGGARISQRAAPDATPLQRPPEARPAGTRVLFRSGRPTSAPPAIRTGRVPPVGGDAYRLLRVQLLLESDDAGPAGVRIHDHPAGRGRSELRQFQHRAGAEELRLSRRDRDRQLDDRLVLAGSGPPAELGPQSPRSAANRPESGRLSGPLSRTAGAPGGTFRRRRDGGLDAGSAAAGKKGHQRRPARSGRLLQIRSARPPAKDHGGHLERLLPRRPVGAWVGDQPAGHDGRPAFTGGGLDRVQIPADQLARDPHGVLERLPSETAPGATSLEDAGRREPGRTPRFDGTRIQQALPGADSGGS